MITGKYFRYLVIAAVIPALAACSLEDDDILSQDSERVPIRFSVSDATAEQTRTSVNASGETQWVYNDIVGIFMTGDAGNRRYTVTNTVTGELSPAAGNELFYPEDGRYVNFVAYYPWKNRQTSDSYAVDVRDQRYSAAIDLLYSNNTRSYNMNSGAVNLSFRHALAKLELTVQKGESSVNLSALTVTIKGINTQAYFNLATGKFSQPTTRTNVEMLCTQQPSGYANGKYEALLLPATSLAGVTVEFKVHNGPTYVWIPSQQSSPALNYLAGGSRYNYTITVNGSGFIARGIEDVYIPPGGFWMGSPLDEPNRYYDETQHRVALTEGFYMSKYEVTNAQYAWFLNANNIGRSGTNANTQWIKASSSPYDWGLHWNGSWWEPAPGCANRPVINVTWWGAKAFANWVGGSLPTEAQWEYACRGGKNLPFGIGTGKYLDGSMANINGRYIYDYGHKDIGWYGVYLSRTTDVGRYQPNVYGLYDMHGNVSEWCLDWYYMDLGNNPVADPVYLYPASSKYLCVLRGGGWNSFAQDCRSARRFESDPDNVSHNNGFRVVFPANYPYHY
ncbi:MAG: SUMF1/EgtB/PvdO family nonheme iron enzyme [Tannerella sp.]|jgi:formylglycine-generating enzyme required for sulfatase activity|nr:SUMF1/EgtB/PvdO family nonheme iron enzyme [Tannerella sp.]